MKTARLLLLLMLAVLLPIRGAMAAAMLCPMAGMQKPAVHGGAGCHDEAGAAATDTCPLCAALCSATPLPSEMPRLTQPLTLAAATFPELAAPAPSFLSDGQERPPRSR